MPDIVVKVHIEVHQNEKGNVATVFNLQIPSGVEFQTVWELCKIAQVELERQFKDASNFCPYHDKGVSP